MEPLQKTYRLTVLPLMMEEKRGLRTLAGFTTSLLLLLYTCCMYSGGTWFLIAAVPVLLGLSVVFLPYVLYSIPLPGVMKRNKGFVCMLADTILLSAVIFTAGFYVNDPVIYSVYGLKQELSLPVVLYWY